MKQFLTAEYVCLSCEHKFCVMWSKTKPQPVPQGCPSCAALYIKWTNYEALFRK